MNIRTKIETIVLGFWLMVLACLVACETPMEDTSAFDQARLDSIALSQRDSLLLDQYLVDNDIDETLVIRMDTDVRYFYTDLIESSPKPELNDLVSVYLNYFFDDSRMILTTNKGVALRQDSLSWVNRWIDEANGGEPQTFFKDTLYVGSNPSDTVFTKNKTLESTLLDLFATKEPLDYTLFFDNVLYKPEVFNYTISGNRMNPGWPIGVREALTEAMPGMRLNTKLTVLCPSVKTYDDINPPNYRPKVVPLKSPLIVEVTIVNIRS